MPDAPWPLVEIMLKLKPAAGANEFRVALDRWWATHSSLVRSVEEVEGDRWTIGFDIDHTIDIKLDDFRRDFRDRAEIARPQPAYRETIQRRGKIWHTHKLPIAGKPAFARVELAIGPRERGSGNRVDAELGDDVVPGAYRSAVRTGIAEALVSGSWAGFPVIDVEVGLIDAAYHSAESTPAAFSAAALGAIRSGWSSCEPIVLEPVMKIELTLPGPVPEGFRATLEAGGARIRSDGERNGIGMLTASMALSSLLGCAASLRQLDPPASLAISFDGYAPAAHFDLPPPPIAAAAALRGRDRVSGTGA